MRRSLPARCDTPLACLVVVVLALALFTVGQALRDGFDASAFVVAGDRFSDPRAVPRGITVLPDSGGYDGQFYYRLALDPFTSTQTDFGITLDNPAYRQQRLLYPLIVRAVSFDRRFVPLAMIATNFGFLCVLAWVAGRLAQGLGRHALWGLLIALYPGFLVTYSRDLVEIVEATFVLCSFWMLRREKPGLATVALTLAVLTRETALLVALAAAVAFAADRVRKRPRGAFGPAYFAVPIGAFVAVQAVLYAVWGHLPIVAGSVVLGAGRLDAFTGTLAAAAAISRTHWIAQIVAAAFVVLATCAIAWHGRATTATAQERIACVLYGSMLASVGGLVWAEDIGFLRVFSQFYLIGAVLIVASRPNRVATSFAALVGATWTFEFFRLGAGSALVRSLQRAIGAA